MICVVNLRFTKNKMVCARRNNQEDWKYFNSADYKGIGNAKQAARNFLNKKEEYLKTKD